MENIKYSKNIKKYINIYKKKDSNKVTIIVDAKDFGRH